jgi:translation initiation factor IF-2
MPASVRVYELAKQLNMSNAQLMDLLRDLDVPVKSHSSVIPDETARLVVEMVSAPSSKQKADAKSPQAPAPQKTVDIFPGITVRELAERLKTTPQDLQKRLIALKMMVPVTHALDLDVAGRLAEQLGFAANVGVRQEEAPKAEARPAARKHSSSTHRPPVVTIMGHVDHGKTTLLDALRNTAVTESEFGGITQHIGAYQLDWDGRRITFLDTPGHAAFTQMRARGAQVTDIVVLVVAADDGIMPQTVEAINHARAAKVPIIVAINKIDRPDANPDRVKTQLTEYDLLAEDYGGDTVMVNISAKARQNLDELLTAILVVAEELNLVGDLAADAAGTVIEAKQEKGRGCVATLLVQQGVLSVGDAIVAGKAYGKIKAMLDERGQKVHRAVPSTPVEVLGLDSVPVAGDRFYAMENERAARQKAQEAEALERSAMSTQRRPVSLKDLRRRLDEAEAKQLNVLIKADVHGSLEAVRQSLERLGEENEEVGLKVLAGAVGNITGSDIDLAKASDAVVVGFNVNVENDARTRAKDEQVDVRVYNVIYELIDEVRKAMLGQLEPVFEEVSIGKAECRAVFRTPRGPVSGCYVIEGKITRSAETRVLRDGQEVWRGRIASLRHVKDDVREVQQGYECGILLDGFADAAVGDIIESYEQREVPRF